MPLMCLAIPARIESIEGDRATVNLAGTKADVVVTLTPEAGIGDWVLIHAGYAITIVTEEDARETFALLRQIADLDADDPPA